MEQSRQRSGGHLPKRAGFCSFPRFSFSLS